MEINQSPTAYHLGFVFGPRLNAGGRVGKSDLGVRLLTAVAEDEIEELAKHLNLLNRERQAIEAMVLDEALEKLANIPPGPAVIVIGDGWHPGVIGIVASRLKERFNCPAFVISLDLETGLCKGSARSVPGVDIGTAVIAARQAGLLEHGGGHSMAAGFSVSSKKLEPFRKFIEERIATSISANSITPTLYFDGAVTTAGANIELIEALQLMAPFGSGNAEPRFVIPSAKVTFADVVGENHIRCTLQSAPNQSLQAISFRSLDTPLGQLLLASRNEPMHIAGRLRLNNWQGRTSPQLLVDDAAQPW